MQDTVKKAVTPPESEINTSLRQIKQYLEKDIRTLNFALEKKEQENKYLQEELNECKETTEGKTQLINKLLGELSKLQNDIEWYKRTYEKRSFLGTIREKLLRVK